MINKRRILIVDDSPSNIEVLSEVLHTEYDLSAATSGIDALDLIAAGTCPDLILLDIVMPNVSGYEVCRQLKADPVNAKIPIIFISALDSPDDETKGLELGAVDYISKPFNPAIVKARVKNQLEWGAAQQHLEQLVDEQVEKIKASQAMVVQQEKLAAIGQIAAGVAHEINNPVGFISSNLNTLSKYIGKIAAYLETVKTSFDGLPEEMRAKLMAEHKSQKIDRLIEDAPVLIAECLEGTERIARIVQGLKSFSRRDETKSMANINQCIENAITVAWNEIKYKATIERDFGELAEIYCYPQQLSQVFMNLLVNAAHAIENQGTISVFTRQKEGQIEVIVKDTGCGIAKENLSKIFEPFFTTKEAGKGTGLGMSIAHEIISKHGGTVQVKSAVGQGTTFLLRLPVMAKL